MVTLTAHGSAKDAANKLRQQLLLISNFDFKVSRHGRGDSALINAGIIYLIFYDDEQEQEHRIILNKISNSGNNDTGTGIWQVNVPNEWCVKNGINYH